MTLQYILAQVTLWVVAPILLSYGLILVYRHRKADREQKRKWAEDGVKQSATREQKLYIERVK